MKKRATKIEDALFKIIMVGKSAVGKSSLLTRYTKNMFQNDYQVTVGIIYFLFRSLIWGKTSKN